MLLLLGLHVTTGRKENEKKTMSIYLRYGYLEGRIKKVSISGSRPEMLISFVMPKAYRQSNADVKFLAFKIRLALLELISLSGRAAL